MEEPSFQFPSVPQLTGEGDLKAWKRHIYQSCIYYGLEGFLLGTEPKPKDVNEVPRWRKRRVHCMALITHSLRTPAIAAQLEMAGWEEDEEDPKELYDLVLSVIPKSSEHSIPKLFYQLIDLKVADTTLLDYSIKVQEITSRIQQLGLPIDDRIKILMVMRKIKSDRPRWHSFLKKDLYGGHLNVGIVHT
ncbi:hypothetical protein F4815DRAFT_498985 [Daldinia loculata]|nr:hypothetical protein F4815DRAFT_498985 [Daldinia loculata]